MWILILGGLSILAGIVLAIAAVAHISGKEQKNVARADEILAPVFNGAPRADFKYIGTLPRHLVIEEGKKRGYAFDKEDAYILYFTRV